MKKIILFLSMLTATAAFSQTNLQYVDIITLSTNAPYTNSALISIPGICTNAPYTMVRVTNIITGDPLPSAFTKINQNFDYLNSRFTNASVVITNITMLAPGATPTVTNLGNGLVAVFQIGLPAPAPNTNTITATTFTNSVLSSAETTLLISNLFVFTGSNYCGSFPGIYQWFLTTPSVGGSGTSPGTNLVENFCVSTNGGTNWFIAPDGFSTTNTVLVSVSGNSNSAPGSLVIYGVDHPELVGRTNAFFGQSYAFANPVLGSDPVTLNYLNSYASRAVASTLQLSTSWSMISTNASGTNHVWFSGFGQTALDLVSVVNYVPINSIALDSTKTNILLTVALTNFVAGSFIETTTNLAIPNWATLTNYTSVTNSGLITFTNPISPAVTVKFYRARGAAVNTVSALATTFTANGTLWPSNAWSLASITNGMKTGDIQTVNSNGLTLVDVWMSNGVPVLKPHW